MKKKGHMEKWRGKERRANERQDRRKKQRTQGTRKECRAEERKWKRNGWEKRESVRVRIKRHDNCFHVEQLPVIQVKHHNTVCGRGLCCEWQTSCKWMIMACLAVGHLRRLCSLLFPANIAGFSLANLSDVLLFLLIFNGITPHADRRGFPTWLLSWRRKTKKHFVLWDASRLWTHICGTSLSSVASASSLNEFLIFNYS